jgi:hypothetical protein
VGGGKKKERTVVRKKERKDVNDNRSLLGEILKWEPTCMNISDGHYATDYCD